MKKQDQAIDRILLAIVSVIVGFGYIMMSSAAMSLSDQQLGDAFYFSRRQLCFLLVGTGGAIGLYNTPLSLWARLDRLLLLVAVALLVAVLIPHVGYTANGARRWLNLGFFKIQVAELAKLTCIVYLSGYLTRQRQHLTSVDAGLMRPMGVVALISALLLLQPDFGSVVVITLTASCLLFIAGVRFRHFFVASTCCALFMLSLAIYSPYRWERLTAFTNPWADQFDSGYQLTQALIAFGRGEWFGLGLGSGIQKLFYLPEAHTDFLFAVIAEECGIVGLIGVLCGFVAFAVRGFKIAFTAQTQRDDFAAFIAYGITVWISLQAVINMGVNTGMLPTKGLTLPFMSYGGSSLIVSLAAVGLLMRVYRENTPSINRRTAK